MCGDSAPLRPGCVVPVLWTRGWNGYSGLAAAGYKQQVTSSRAGRNGARGMQRIHMVLAAKRWLIGTQQGGIQQQHLDYYLDEFTFRFNAALTSSGIALSSPRQQAVAVPPALSHDRGEYWFTPILVLLLGAVGLSALVGWLDVVLLPALALFLGITAYALWRRHRSA